MRIIDVHVHPPIEELYRSYGPYGDSLARFFKGALEPKGLEQLISDFDEAGIEKIVILGWDAETNTGLPPLSNDVIAKMVDCYPDRLIGFASVDPHKGKAAVKELERSIKELGLRGLKLHQIAQGFYPNEERFYPLWAKAEELEIPVLFHMGMAAWGAGMKGGGGMRLKYSNPIYIDDVAADFPELKILAAHPAWPWEDTLLAIALHKPNVYMDLSGWMPKYIPQSVIVNMNTRLSDRFMFGSDYPHISPKRWIEEFSKLELKPEVREKVLELNARRFLGL